MADEQTSGGGSAAFRCPWCSAPMPAADLDACPSCGATLTSGSEAALPGVTAIDHEAILRATREPVRQPRSRFLSWLSGAYIEEAATETAATEAIAPPDPAVRREILRLEIEAEIADRQAEADSIMADAAVEGRPIPGVTDGEPEAAHDAETMAVAPPYTDAATTAPDAEAIAALDHVGESVPATTAPMAAPDPGIRSDAAGATGAPEATAGLDPGDDAKGA